MQFQALGPLLLAAVLLSACATSNPGWTGSGAEPFDVALASCEEQVKGAPEEENRDAALESCMAERGWTRP